MNLLIPLSLVACMYYGNVSVGHGAKGRIGILYDPVRHKIVKIYKYSPAEDVGLRIGDIVVHINAADIRGPAYTKINLTIRRGNRILHFEIERCPNECIDEHQVAEDSNEQFEIDFSIPPETA